MAQTPHIVAVEATSRSRKCGHETPQLRLEQRLHVGSPYRCSDLVSAGPGASVVNLSIGQPKVDPYGAIPRSDPWVHDPAVSGTIYYLSDAIRYAESKGVVVVTAAGNDGYQNQPNGVDIDASGNTWPIYPAYTHTGNMLVVASVDATGT